LVMGGGWGWGQGGAVTFSVCARVAVPHVHADGRRREPQRGVESLQPLLQPRVRTQQILAAGFEIELTSALLCSAAPAIDGNGITERPSRLNRLEPSAIEGRDDAQFRARRWRQRRRRWGAMAAVLGLGRMRSLNHEEPRPQLHLAKRHTSHVTRHTSHVTRHTSHVTPPPHDVVGWKWQSRPWFSPHSPCLLYLRPNVTKLHCGSAVAPT
jgi:hypothetical protein